jgi:hypothetical protein
MLRAMQIMKKIEIRKPYDHQLFSTYSLCLIFWAKGNWRKRCAHQMLLKLMTGVNLTNMRYGEGVQNCVMSFMGYS